MLRSGISIILSALLICGPVFAEKKPTIKEQAVTVSAGSSVEVKLLNGQKLRGRMGEVSATGFVLQSVNGDKAVNRTISFDEAGSIRAVHHTVRILLIVVGVVAAVAIAARVAYEKGGVS